MLLGKGGKHMLQLQIYRSLNKNNNIFPLPIRCNGEERRTINELGEDI